MAFLPDFLGQALNGLAYGALLFLLSVGLTLIFGMLDVVNLAHGSFYMLGAYAGLATLAATGNFWLAALAAPVAVGLIGACVERGLLRPLYRRGPLDQVIMRLTDAWLAFPFLILAIGLVTVMGPSLTNATLAIGLGAAPTFIRLTRGLVLSTNEEDYVHGARALGGGDVRVMARHILPNIVSPLIVQATVSVPMAIIFEAVLSFLGLGVQPPMPSWGTMLNTAQQFLEQAPWMAWWPGLAILVLTLAFNLAGDGLRDVLDPRDY